MLEIVKSYFQKAIKIIKFPKSFLKDLHDEGNIKIALKYLGFLFIVNSIAIFIFSLIMAYVNNPQIDLAAVLPGAVIYFVIGGIVGWITTLFLGVILHLYSKLFRGKAKLLKTIQLFIYASTPTLLFGWLPIGSIVASLYMLYIMYLGGMEIHGLTKRNSLIAFVIIPLVLIIGSTLVQLPQ